MGKIAQRGLIALINFYRNHLSSMKRPSCRFQPTCSAYAVEAIGRYGAMRGFLLTVWRILRCNPFGKGGYDPVK
ncbi:MAG: membrane protein insertion efficiency factor YidD [Oscillospiraceae bacterium]|nr:membrane protein insertion efficiency factor YidD [Oscillospiraceae bacterium]